MTTIGSPPVSFPQRQPQPLNDEHHHHHQREQQLLQQQQRRLVDLHGSPVVVIEIIDEPISSDCYSGAGQDNTARLNASESDKLTTKQNCCCRVVGLLLLIYVLATRRLRSFLIRGIGLPYGVRQGRPSVFNTDYNGRMPHIIKPLKTQQGHQQPSQLLLAKETSAIPSSQTGLQFMLILGGNLEREVEGIKYFIKHRHLFNQDSSVVLSSGALTKEDLIRRTLIKPSELFEDRNAVDTVTNFTTLVDKFEGHAIAVGTSSSHLPRATRIARIVLGASDVEFLPVELPPGDEPPESCWRSIRDVLRSLIWVFTGMDFRFVSRWYKAGPSQ